MTILNRTAHAFFKKQPFVVYRKPNEILVKGVFPKNTELYFTSDYSEKGFVFAPFNTKNQSVIFPLAISEVFEEKIVTTQEIVTHTHVIDNDIYKENFLQLVKKGITVICNNELKKVVLSRKETVILANFNLISSFKKLLQLYKNAFVYVWYHPKVGLWMGATPETLLLVKKNQFTTMALAGTQVFKDTKDVIWQEKELQEQQFVTDFIMNNLSKITDNFQKSVVKTVKAGNLLHLKTIITGNFYEQSLKEIIKILHPTPAVCGVSREKATSFILKNENYDRKFYTGFLGELNVKESSSLFVNLRCMKIENDTATIYVGGGITKDSNPQKEWEETVAKSKVMKFVL